MTKPCRDLDAVTELLDEKEKDLELAAKIGKSLLERNRDLEQRNEFLEEQMTLTNEQVTQLRHELQQKMRLLDTFAESDADSAASTPSTERRFLGADTELRRRVDHLESENSKLKIESSSLKSTTKGLEEKEQQLVKDCVRQLQDANAQLSQLQSELADKSEECSSNRQEIDRLLQELAERQNAEKKMQVENDELTRAIRIAQETQTELTREILELQERYAEVMAILHEAQEELRFYRTGIAPPLRCGSALADSLYDSLASELEASDSGFWNTPLTSARSVSKDTKDFDDIRPPFRNESNAEDEGASLGRLWRRSKTPSPSPPQRGSPESRLSPESEHSHSDGLSRAPSMDSLAGYPSPSIGEPGTPGTRDLDFAIRRLCLRRKVELDYQKFRKDRGYGASSAVCLRNKLNGAASLKARSSNSSAPNSSAHSFCFKTPYQELLVRSRYLERWRSMAASPSLFLLPPQAAGVQTRTQQTSNDSPSSCSDSGFCPQLSETSEKTTTPPQPLSQRRLPDWECRSSTPLVWSGRGLLGGLEARRGRGGRELGLQAVTEAPEDSARGIFVRASLDPAPVFDSEIDESVD